MDIRAFGKIIHARIENKQLHVHFGHDDEGFKILNIPAISKETAREMVSERCRHDFDCCGCQFWSYVSRRMFGLFSIARISQNI